MGNPKNDLTNKQFGQLTVIKYLGNSKWNCSCECGNYVQVKTASLNSGKTKSCGCLRGQSNKGNVRQSKPRIDITNQKFGNLTALYYLKGGKWHCKCECGNEIDVDTRNLNSGHTKSCGCLLKKINSENNTLDMTNYEDENIKVLNREGSDDKGSAMWKCICKHCGNQFITRGSNIRNGTTKSCGCVHSYHEQQITKILIENNIEFSSQYTFPDLIGVNGGHLRFDFAIFKNKVLSHLIEYNGLQHYQEPQGKWKEGYETLVEHDKRKIQYCKENNIELRIIKYDQTYTLKDLI
jgi:hypothetical protein